jgi:hypothetical protein
MAGERSLEGVLAGSGSGAGTPGRLGLLLAMEAGVPIPIPSDLVMLLLGERVSAGALPLWVAALALELVALAGTAALLLAAGRTTPGLRTVTVVAAAAPGSGRVGPCRPWCSAAACSSRSICSSATPSARRPGSCWPRPACRSW